MTNKNLTEIVCVVDRSGSMRSIANDAIGGFNAFLKEQQEDKSGECRLTYVQFDHEYEVVHNGININDMKPLDDKTFVPRGMTALRDALGRTIQTVGERLAKTPEENRPGNVTILILTDGEENSSLEFSDYRIKEMINHQIEKYNWSFIYLAQNIDAFDTGQQLGLDMNSGGVYIGNVKAGGQSHVGAYYVASRALSSKRRKLARGQSLDWSNDEKSDYTSQLEDESDNKN